jgi:hypothetical protein
VAARWASGCAHLIMAVPLLLVCLGRTPDTYHTAGHERGPPPQVLPDLGQPLDDLPALTIHYKSPVDKLATGRGTDLRQRPRFPHIQPG